MPVLGFFFVANGLTRQSRTSAALHGAMLAIGAAIVAMQFLWKPKAFSEVHVIPGGLVSAGWLLLAYGIFISVFKLPRTAILALILMGMAYVPIAGYVGTPTRWLVIAVVALIALSMRYLWLQWPLGFAAIIGAGLWGSGMAGDMIRDYSDWMCRSFLHHCVTRVAPQQAVLIFSVIIAIAIFAAVWTASPYARVAEGWGAKLLKWFEKKRESLAAKRKGSGGTTVQAKQSGDTADLAASKSSAAATTTASVPPASTL